MVTQGKGAFEASDQSGSCLSITGFCINQNYFYSSLDGMLTTGFVPFFRIKINSPYCLSYILYFSLELNKFPALSRTSSRFPGLSSPGKCHSKIPGLSRFSRTHTNPVTSPLQGLPSITFAIHVGEERGTVGVKHLAQEHNPGVDSNQGCSISSLASSLHLPQNRLTRYKSR